MSRHYDAVAAVDVIAALDFGIMDLFQQPDGILHEVTAKDLRDALVKAYKEGHDDGYYDGYDDGYGDARDDYGDDDDD